MFGRDCNPVYLFRASDIPVEEEYSQIGPLHPNTDEDSCDILVDPTSSKMSHFTSPTSIWNKLHQ